MAKQQHKTFVKWIGEKMLIDGQVTIVQKDKVCSNFDVDKIYNTVKLYKAPLITRQGGTYQGQATDVSNTDYIVPVLHALYADVQDAWATHNVYAYRISTQDGTIQHFDDHGEWGAGKRTSNTENKLLVVSRWYGGQHLGPTQFKLIMEAARQAIS